MSIYTDESTIAAMAAHPGASSPLMQQYLEIKSRYPDCLLFFRMGDFYELFFEDAKVAAKILEIALTSRNKNSEDPVPMCGVPHHSAPGYIHRLVASNYKIAICEQLEEASAGKGIVKRDVVRVMTPGTRFDLEALDSKTYNYTMAVFQKTNSKLAWCACDFSTGDSFFGTCDRLEDWLSLVQSIAPTEILIPQNTFGDDAYRKLKTLSGVFFPEIVPEFYFENTYSTEKIFEQFSTQSLKSVHPELEEAHCALGALIKRFQETQKQKIIPALVRIEKYDDRESMQLDLSTQQALELFPHKTKSVRDTSLFKFLDRTKTAMGGRTLKKWISKPLLHKQAIEERFEHLTDLISMSENEKKLLSEARYEIYDFERLLSRLSLSPAPRDLQSLLYSLESCKKVFSFLQKRPSFQKKIVSCVGLMNHLEEVCARVDGKMVVPAPLSSKEGGIFTRGYHKELDELLEICENGEKWLTEYEASEREKTQINNLKVRFNRVFGYYIEITKSNLKNVPDNYIRKQTTVGGERYITEELKAFEEKVLTSERSRNELELELFQEISICFLEKSKTVLEIAQAIGQVDVLCALSEVCAENEYSRPELTNEKEIILKDAKHPTLSVLLEKNPPYSSFVANNLAINANKSFFLITGPNMGGKSTIMRTTALITLLSQMGCFVPATFARIGIVDRIFTRIGANDNASDGESTFMVEMSEMSYILRHATERSLILIDEIGRGTSTYDGLSLAWAIALEIAGKKRCRTLFSTHYHELTGLEKTCSTVQNHNVGVEFTDSGKLKFLYKLNMGAAERSYGVHVARLAGLPESVLSLSERILNDLEKKKASLPKQKTSNTDEIPQLSLL